MRNILKSINVANVHTVLAYGDACLCVTIDGGVYKRRGGKEEFEYLFSTHDLDATVWNAETVGWREVSQ